LQINKFLLRYRILFACFLFLNVLKSVCVLAQNYEYAASFRDLDSPVTCMTITPDGTLLITGDSSGAFTFREAETGKLINREKAFNNAVENINFNSTGRLMIAHTRDGEIKIYDFAKRKFIQSLYSPEYSDMHFALFSIADGFIYFNGQGRLYKTRSDLSQPPVKIFEYDSILTNAVITEDRSALIFTSGNILKVLNTRYDNISQQLVISQAKIERLAISADHNIVTWSSDGTIMIRAFELNQLEAHPLLWFKAGMPGRLVFSHDGKMMVTGNVGTWARIWKPEERSVIQELFGHQDVVNNFVFGAADKVLFTASNDKTIKIWKQKTDEEKKNPVDSKLVDVPVKSNISPPDSARIPIVMEQDSSMPAIKLDDKNVPVHIGGRKVNKTTTIEVTQPTIDIYVFDNASSDGDIMSLSFQNEWILKHYEVTKKKHKITLQLKAGSNNFLVLFADNLGRTPPNTAAISFVQNNKERIFRLVSDLESCSAINFIYRK
jgi:WD40 repeat protein